jgi:hypothetical protein
MLKIAKKPSANLIGLADLASAERNAREHLHTVRGNLAIRVIGALGAGFGYDDIARLTIAPTAKLSEGHCEVNRLRQLVCRYRRGHK